MERPSLIEELRRFVAERDWSQFHDSKNLTMLLASEAGELLAEYRWVSNEQADRLSHEAEARGRIAAEIGDVGIALYLLCDRIGLDLETAMREKLARNRQRYPVELSKGRSARPSVSEASQAGTQASLLGTDLENPEYASPQQKE
jgi:NTP pyrophosphatase (non-canonical NTP hydrolase)